MVQIVHSKCTFFHTSSVARLTHALLPELFTSLWSWCPPNNIFSAPLLADWWHSFIAMKYRCSLDDYAALAALAVPVPNREDDRLKIVRESNIIDGNYMDEDYDRLTALAARVLKTPHCAISIIEVNYVCVKSSSSNDFRAAHASRDDSICTYVVLEDSPECLCIPDITKDTRFQHLPAVTGPAQLRFYAGAAIQIGDIKLGTICVLDTVPHHDFDRKQQDILLGIAAIVSQTLAQRHDEMMQKALEATQLAMSIVYNLKHPLRIACNMNKALADDYHAVSRDGSSTEPSTDEPQQSTSERSLAQFKQSMAQFCSSMKHLGALIETSLSYAHMRDMQRCDVLKHLVTVQDTVHHLLVTSNFCAIKWIVDDSLFHNKVHFTFPYALQQALLCSIFNLSMHWTDIAVNVAFEAEGDAGCSSVDGSILIQIISRQKRALSPRSKHNSGADTELGQVVVQSVLHSVGGSFAHAYHAHAATNSVVCTGYDTEQVSAPKVGIFLHDDASTEEQKGGCLESLSVVLDHLVVNAPSVMKPQVRGAYAVYTLTLPCVLLPRSAKARK